MIDFGFPPLRSPSVTAVITKAAWLVEASNSGAIAIVAKRLVRLFKFILLLSGRGFSLLEGRHGIFREISNWRIGGDIEHLAIKVN